MFLAEIFPTRIHNDRVVVRPFRLSIIAPNTVAIANDVVSDADKARRRKAAMSVICRPVIAALMALATRGDMYAVPPEHLQAELVKLKTPTMIVKVNALPKRLKQSLGRAYRNPRLDLASVGEPVRESPGVIVGDAESEADARRPSRRLIFAFETPSFYVVYYERRTPVAAAALIFDKVRNPQLLWGGLDFHEPWAKSPKALSRRILQNRLDDTAHPYW